MRRLTFLCPRFFLVSTALPCFSQQTDIRQFVVFGAYTYLATPSLNLAQRGFDGDLGYNYRSWLSFGFDFGYYNGHSSLFPGELNPAALATLPPLGPFPSVAAGFLTTFRPKRMRPDRNSITASEEGDLLRASGARGIARECQSVKHFSPRTQTLGAELCTLLNGCSKTTWYRFTASEAGSPGRSPRTLVFV